MMSKNLLKMLCVAVFSLTCISDIYGQTMMPLPSHTYNYCCRPRGYLFTAPTDFTIVGLRVAAQAGSGTQRIQVMKVSSNTNGNKSNVNTLYYTNNGTNGQILPVNIPITQGDHIVILGYAGSTNSYGSPSGTYNIAGHGVTLKRCWINSSIAASPVNNVNVTTGSISRVEMYYETCDVVVNNSPQPKTLCEGKDTDLSVSATITGGPGAYRWQVDEGSGFNDVVNGGPYSGATSNKLEISNTPFSLNGYEYRCIVEEGTCADTSMPAALTVNGLVKLTDLAKNDTTCIKSIKDIEIKATGSITNYQWQMKTDPSNSFVNVPSTAPYIINGNKLQINGATLSQNGYVFRVQVDGVCDNALSNETKLTVNDVPKTAVPPADVNTKQGQRVRFEVQSTVTPAKYQWQVASPNDTFVNINEGGIYVGTRTNKLEVIGVSRVQDNFKFRCIIKTATGCVAPGDTSNFGILYVEPALSVENVAGDNQLGLYPNPTNGNLYIQSGKHTTGMTYQVLDKTGRVVLSGDMSDTQDTQVDVSSLPVSMYLVRVLNADNSLEATLKFTKM